ALACILELGRQALANPDCTFAGDTNMRGPRATETRASVVIPAHNDADRAVALAGALSTQQLPDGATLEVIVVDDGSDPSQWEKLKSSLHASFSGAFLVRLDINKGRSAARNAGAAAATGKWLIFIDSDCLPVDERLVAKHLEVLK